ncbi:MAG: redoxin domain-containing protein [Bacteroidales bacterium]|nr:redoxin domain-containing protein [Bacteroidales bacterium]
MKKTLLALGAFMCAALSSCDKSNSSVINVEVENAPDSAMVVFSARLGLELTPLDTAYLTSPKCSFKLDVPKDGANFAYVNALGKVVPLIVLPGDKINVKIGSDVVIGGSEESVLLQKVNADYDAFISALNEVLANESQVKEVNKSLSRIFIQYKRACIAYTFAHPRSLTLLSVVSQKVNDNLYVFGDNSDAVLMSRVYDSLSVYYPASPYLKTLKNDIDTRMKALALENKLRELGEADFPEISLRDVSGKEVALSSMKGQPFLLVFWSSSAENIALFNAELKEIYGKYNPRGLQIYQVGIDVDKAVWASEVKSQGLDWVNVCDSRGSDSPYISLYNLYHIPSVYMFNSKGELVGNCMFDTEDVEKEIQKIL